MSSAPIWECVGLKGDAGQKLRGVCVWRADELVKVAVRRGRGQAARSCRPRTGRPGRGRAGRSTDEEGPVEGEGLAAFVLVAPELGKFDGVMAGGDLDWTEQRRGRGRGRHWDRSQGVGRGGDVARGRRVGWVRRVSRSSSMGRGWRISLRGGVGICGTGVINQGSSTREEKRELTITSTVVVCVHLFEIRITLNPML